MRPSGIVTLVTDFGTADGYAGALKAVILSRDRSLAPCDVSHDIPPGDVVAAAWCVHTCARLFPPGTVHLVVVDPGVGSVRRPLAIRSGDQLFVGPDNGVFDLVGGDLRWARALDHSSVGGDLSCTFHGRDLFAPAAAALASGADPRTLGPVVDPGTLVGLALDGSWSLDGDRARGRVVHVDRFGNLVTSLPESLAPRGTGGSVGDVEVLAPVSCYADIPSGRAAFITGSAGLMEISARDGSAAALCAARRADPVTMFVREEP